MVILRFLCCFYNDMGENRVKLGFKAGNTKRVKLLKSLGKTTAIFFKVCIDVCVQKARI